MKAIHVTTDLRKDLTSAFEIAKKRTRSADAKLPSDAASRFLKALPYLLSTIDEQANDDARVWQGRSRSAVTKKVEMLDQALDALKVTRGCLGRLERGPEQPTDRALALLAGAALDRLSVMLLSERAFTYANRKRRGAPNDPWSRACKHVIAKWWIQQDWVKQLTTSEDAAIVAVLRALHYAHDVRKGRPTRDRLALDDLREVFQFAKRFTPTTLQQPPLRQPG